jgi:predicted phage terminase large subunit-like protein
VEHKAYVEICRRKAALDGIRDFIPFMASSGHPDYAHVPAKHHELLLDAFQRVVNGDIQKLMIFLPPGAAKSTYLRILCAWVIARNPRIQMLRIMATQHLAERQARMLRSAIQEEPFKLLSSATLLSDMQAAGAFGLDKGAVVVSSGAGASIQGLRSEFSILDDLVPSWEAAYSETWRASIMDWYWSEFITRRVPNAPIVWVNTRWHQLDPCGQVLNQENDWEVIRLPLLAEEGDPLGRARGDVLWPEWYTDQMVQEAQRNPEVFAGMYQQQPYMQTGDFFAPGDFEIVERPPENLGVYASIDLAMSEKQTADATAILIAGMAADGTMYILDCYKHRCSPEKTIERLQALHDEYRYRELLIEDSPAERVFKDLCHKLFRQQGRPLPMVSMPTRGRDKTARAQSARGLAKMSAIKLVRAAWNADFIRELSEFPAGRHDDLVDALSILAQRAAKMAPSMPTVPRKAAPPILGGIAQDETGKLFTTQTLDNLWEDNKPLRISPLRI